MSSIHRVGRRNGRKPGTRVMAFCDADEVVPAAVTTDRRIDVVRFDHSDPATTANLLHIESTQGYLGGRSTAAAAGGYTSTPTLHSSQYCQSKQADPSVCWMWSHIVGGRPQVVKYPQVH